MINADAHFWRGEGHVVCQDYALTAEDIVVLCDGCSSSPHVDVGARLLAHAALTHPAWVEEGDPSWLAPPRDAVRALGLPLAALDATCLLARCDPDAAYVTMLGDGVVAARTFDGRIETYEVTFDAGTPSYPSYALEPDRAAAYRAAGLDACHVHASADARITPTRIRGGHRWVFERDRYCAVLIASDGVGAVFTQESEPKPTADIVQHLFHYPAPHGAFVTRRLRRFMTRQAPAMGLRPLDDISLGALCWGEPTCP